MYLCTQRANTITELKMQLVCKKMQCKHALIPTEWHKDFLFQKGKKKGKASWLNSRHNT